METIRLGDQGMFDPKLHDCDDFFWPSARGLDLDTEELAADQVAVGTIFGLGMGFFLLLFVPQTFNGIHLRCPFSRDGAEHNTNKRGD